MIGVAIDASWEGELSGRVPDDMPNSYLASQTCVLTHMTKAASHFDKDLSFVQKPSQLPRTRLPPNLRNVALTDTSVNDMPDMYPGDVVVTLRPTEEAITEGVMCVLVSSPVITVMGRTAERVVWLDVETIGHNGVRLKPIVSVDVAGILVFDDSTDKLQQLTAFTKSIANLGTIPSGERYVIYILALYIDSSQQN